MNLPTRKNTQLIDSVKKHDGFSLVEVLVASALMLVVFVGIAGAFQTIIELASYNKAKVSALAVVSEKMEFIRNLSYDNIGTVSGIPSGTIPQTEIVSLNGIDYTRRVLVQYVDAPEDGIAGADINGITTDYKRVKVEVSWAAKNATSTVFSVSNFVPKGIETIAGGGTLIVNVLDAVGVPVASADVHIENNILNPVVSVDTFTNISGQVLFPGSPAGSSYEVTVTKSGYSTAKTYASDISNPNPSPGHMSVIEGQTNALTLQIDVFGSKTVKTYEQIKSVEWKDVFNDTSNISVLASTTISGGDLILSGGAGNYESDGYIYSATTTPTYLASWEEVSWIDNNPPSTDIKYKIYDASGVSPVIISDGDMSGNSSGFTGSPIDISGLSISTYPSIQIAAFLNTADSNSTPSILEWKIKYKEGPIPLPNLAFNMRGDKTIGTDGGGSPIYKYSKNLQTDGSGVLSITPLEWDSYTITIDNNTLGLDIGESCEPQSLSLLPGMSTTTSLYFVSQTMNSLLVDVRNSSGNLLSSVSVRLYRSGVDITKTSSLCGQSFFSGVSSGTVSGGDAYTIDLSLAGYTDTTVADVEVSGASTVSVVIDD